MKIRPPCRGLKQSDLSAWRRPHHSPLPGAIEKERISVGKRAFRTDSFFFGLFVIPLGLEPKTHSLEGCCSIQLSYGTIPFQKGLQSYNFFSGMQ